MVGSPSAADPGGVGGFRMTDGNQTAPLRSALDAPVLAARDALAARGLSVLLAFLPLACTHQAPRVHANEAHPNPGDVVVPIRSAEDMVGHYVAIPESDVLRGETLDIYIEADALCMRTDSSGLYWIAIRNDGTLTVPGHFGASLIRRGTRTLLFVGWAYRDGVYEPRYSARPTAALQSCHGSRAPEAQ